MSNLAVFSKYKVIYNIKICTVVIFVYEIEIPSVTFTNEKLLGKFLYHYHYCNA